MNDLYFGFLSDFDLPGGFETASYDSTLKLLMQSGNGGPLVGVVGLSSLLKHQTLSNGTAKTGFTKNQLYSMISSGAVSDLSGSGDLMSMFAGGPYRLTPGDSVEVALALVVGNTSAEIRDRAAKAFTLYQQPTDVNNPSDVLPNAYELYQNYPNPFNPTTTIAFDLPASGEVRLEVFNLLGQRVKELSSGRMNAGSHNVEWDGCNDAGQGVASGVYFYRLSVDGLSSTRKMVLLR